MTDWRLIKPDDGSGHTMHMRVEADGSVTIRETMDLEPYLDANARLFNDGDGYSPSRELRRVASVPPILMNELYQKGLNPLDPDNRGLFRKHILNNSDYQRLRTAPGRV